VVHLDVELRGDEASWVNLKWEQAALAWTEALTLVAVNHVPDAGYEEVRPKFNDE
jgi:alkylhydroperoxidase family enzyme